MKFLFLLLFLPFAGYAQYPGLMNWNEQNAAFIQSPGILPIMYDDTAIVAATKRYIISRIPYLGADHSDLKPVAHIKSPLGRHITFTQTYNNVEIYGSQVKVNIAANRAILSILHKSIPTTNWSISTVTELEPDILRIITGNRDRMVWNHTWYVQNDMGISAWKVNVASHYGNIHDEYVVSPAYEVLRKTDKNVYLQAPDSLVKAFVFLPDPLTSAQKTYGSPYVDSADGNVEVLNDERKEVEISVTFRNDTFFLWSPYMKSVDFSPPHISPTVSLIPVFNFTRSEPGFEETNIFYHIHNYQAHIQRLGFTLANFQLPVDAHALGGDDNSKFNYFLSDFKLMFGIGGVDDAEDADVIIHEYSHCLSYMASPETFEGFERRVLDEGLADYFACSYSRAISEYRWEWVYNWDGHNPFFVGRVCNSSKIYPIDISGSPYKDGEIWSSALMEMWPVMGRDTVDKLMLSTLYHLAKNLRLRDAAKIFLQQDSMLYAGAHTGTIMLAFHTRGLMDTPSSVKMKNDFRYVVKAQFISQEQLYFETGEAVTGIAILTDVQGRQLATINLYNAQTGSLYVSNLSKGIYFLRIMGDRFQSRVKIVN
ncbi:MAG: T9SS type A sorting domain-containing protein [Bacteroidota bacterium]|nr:T9SS type A sorting domain-containing protein [Bacteroidota bacterium]